MGRSRWQGELRPDAVILRQPGRGKGDALLCGFRAATGEIIVTFDGDGSARAEEIPRFVDALDYSDFAKGSRFVEGGGSADLTRLRRWGNRFLCGLVNLLHRTAYTDLCYGFNAFRRSCLPHIPDSAPGFEIETMVNIRVARADLRVVEVPSYEDLRHFGQSNLHAVRDGFKILRVLDPRAISVEAAAVGHRADRQRPDGRAATACRGRGADPPCRSGRVDCPCRHRKTTRLAASTRQSRHEAGSRLRVLGARNGVQLLCEDEVLATS